MFVELAIVSSLRIKVAKIFLLASRFAAIFVFSPFIWSEKILKENPVVSPFHLIVRLFFFSLPFELFGK